MIRLLLVSMLAVLLLAPLVRAETKPEPFRAYAVPSRIETSLPPRGRNGDREMLRWTIRDQDGHAFAVAILNCNWHRRERLCFGVIRLALGHMIVAGSSPSREFGELTILHGTGAYATPRSPLRYNATRRGRLTLRGEF